MKLKTSIAFAKDDFERLLDLSYWNGLRIINPETGVGEARTITLEATPGSLKLHMSYFPINVNGDIGRSIRFWWKELPVEADMVAHVVGVNETDAIEAVMASSGIRTQEAQQ